MSKYNRRSHGKERWRLVTRLMARDGHNCTICDLPLDRHIRDPFDPMYITFDHIVPRSLGGLDSYANKRLAHQLCNGERGNDPVPVAEELRA